MSTVLPLSPPKGQDERSDSLFLTSDLLRGLGVSHGFSLRRGGVSAAPFDTLNLGRAVGDQPAAVDENLRRFLAAVGITPESLATVRQVHGDRVVWAPAGIAGLWTEDGRVIPDPVEADAIIAEPGRSPAVRTADCLAILLFDPRSRVVAAVHAGWRGTLAQVVVRALSAMERVHHVRAGDVAAVVGPGIGRCCYRVGRDLADRFAADPDLGPTTVERAGPADQPRLDLAGANRRLLAARGVRRVDVLGICTSCRSDLFFSHRRDRGRTGRHLAAISA